MIDVRRILVVSHGSSVRFCNPQRVVLRIQGIATLILWKPHKMGAKGLLS